MDVIDICEGFRGFAVPPLRRSDFGASVDDSVSIDFVVPGPLALGQEVRISVSVTDFAVRQFTGIPRLLYSRDLPGGKHECCYRLQTSPRATEH
jgi:hypothetical protein